jgi:hypothetical protein
MENKDFIVLVTKKGMGSGPEELQMTLLAKYLQLLDQNQTIPAAICFYTEGVKLVTEPSPVLDLLAGLEKKKVRLVVCSTCLSYFGITGQLKVGTAGSMADIIEAQMMASKVITI